MAFDIKQLLNLVLVFAIFWCLVLCAGVLVQRSVDKKTARSFAFWVLANGLSLGGLILNNFKVVVVSPVLISLFVLFPLLVGPLYYLYIGFLFGLTDRWKASLLLHFLLPVLAGAAMFIALSLRPVDPGIVRDAAQQRFWYGIIRIRLCVQFAWIMMYYIACVTAIARIRERSASEKMAGRFRLRTLVIAMTLAYLAGYAALFSVIALSPDFPALAVNGLFVYIVAVASAHYFLTQRYPVLTAVMAADGTLKRTKARELDSEFARGLEEKLLKKIEDEKIYLVEDLTLAMLAHDLGIRPYQLSQFLNTYYKTNFNRMINSYRIRDAAHLLISDPGITVLAAGYAVGFNSKASFNRSFRDQMGLSPSAYRKKHL